jgi:hypothetical protein
VDRLSAILACLFLLCSCVSSSDDARSASIDHVSDKTVYANTNYERISIFYPTETVLSSMYFLSDTAIRSPTKYFNTNNGMACVSIGPPNTSVEFAIRRPISQDDMYTCNRTSFRVIKCFANCNVAIIEVVVDRGNVEINEKLKSFMYVDDCRGILAMNASNPFVNGIPADGEWLRSDFGILSKQSAECTN